MHAIKDVVRKRGDDHIYLQPIIESTVLLRIERSNLFVADRLELLRSGQPLLVQHFCFLLTLVSLFLYFSRASWSTLSMSFFFISAIRLS